MDNKKLTNSELNNVSGGDGDMYTDEQGNIVFKNVCKTCGKEWEYVLEKGACMPNWVTGPWCQECRRKRFPKN